MWKVQSDDWRLRLMPRARAAEAAPVQVLLADHAAALVDGCAYAILDEGDEAFFSPQQKVFLGERYGGEGLGVHGGGVRCGVAGVHQVKGIGRNPLVGDSPDFWHSHGGASLAEGLYEAVWGEVLQRALPHAVQVARGRRNALALVEHQAHRLGLEVVIEASARPPRGCLCHRSGHRIHLSEDVHVIGSIPPRPQ